MILQYGMGNVVYDVIGDPGDHSVGDNRVRLDTSGIIFANMDIL